jgi:hypothetical protein
MAAVGEKQMAVDMVVLLIERVDGFSWLGWRACQGCR